MDIKKIILVAVGVLILATAAFFAGRMSGERKESVPDRAIIEKKQVVSPVAVTPEKEAFLAVVLDDFGYSIKNFSKIQDLGIPLTLAVLPGLRYSREACEMGIAKNLEIILHLPMEPEAKTWAREKNTVMAGMGEVEVAAILDESLGSLKGVSGVSNHMGSKATGDKKAALALMSSLKEKDLFFLDSYTTARSVCQESAGVYNVRYFKRDIFIDNDLNKNSIKSRLMEAADIALRKGSAIAIGHDKTETLDALREVAPDLKNKGIRFVTLTKLGILTAK